MENIDLFTRRLDQLEKENKRLKRTVLLLCIVGGAMFVMGQTRNIPKVIEAEQFVLRDGKGKEKAWLRNGKLGPELKIEDIDAKRATFTLIDANSMHMFRTGEGKEISMLFGPGGVSFWANENGEEQKVSMYATGPTIDVLDKQGFETIIGRTDLETAKTGESHKTSAASIVIFDKDKKVIWKAPVP